MTPEDILASYARIQRAFYAWQYVILSYPKQFHDYADLRFFQALYREFGTHPKRDTNGEENDCSGQ